MKAQTTRQVFIGLLLALAGSAQAQDGYAGWNFTIASATSWWVDTGGVNQSNGYRGEPIHSGPNAGFVSWSGQGEHSASETLPNWITSPESIAFRSASAGLTANGTQSGAEFSLPAAAAWPAEVRSEFHLYSLLDENEPSYGAESTALVRGDFYTGAADSPYAPLYYRIDWLVQASGDATLRASIMIANGDNVYTLSDGNGSILGVLDLDYYPWPGTALNRPFMLTTSAGDGAGLPATGRVDLWATLTLSRSPLQPVPEPGTWALMLAGLGLLLTLRRAR